MLPIPASGPDNEVDRKHGTEKASDFLFTKRNSEYEGQKKSDLVRLLAWFGLLVGYGIFDDTLAFVLFASLLHCTYVRSLI